MESYLKSLFAIGLLLISVFSNATTFQTRAVYIDSISVIGPAAFGHQAGNMEIAVAGGLGSPSGVTCDVNYVATKNTVPNFKEMLSVLLTAQIAQKQVFLGITDDPTLTAFSGRCSVVSVSIVR